MGRTLGDILKSRKEKEIIVKNMTDSEKLDYIVSILNRNINMLTEDSDTHGINFTEEYDEQQQEIEDFLNFIKTK